MLIGGKSATNQDSKRLPITTSLKKRSGQPSDIVVEENSLKIDHKEQDKVASVSQLHISQNASTKSQFAKSQSLSSDYAAPTISNGIPVNTSYATTGVQISCTSTGARHTSTATANTVAETSSANTTAATTPPPLSTANGSGSSSSGGGVNKKIPKPKWRPLQIDVVKSSRPKPISRNPRRGFASRVERGVHEDRGTNDNGETHHSTSGSSNNNTFERPTRPNRRFRTSSYRGGRQRGGYSRQGPSRATNRIPRHLLVNCDYANFSPDGSEHPFVLMGTHYYNNVPAAFIEMDAQTVKEAIKKQV